MATRSHGKMSRLHVAHSADVQINETNISFFFSPDQTIKSKPTVKSNHLIHSRVSALSEYIYKIMRHRAEKEYGDLLI